MDNSSESRFKEESGADPGRYPGHEHVGGGSIYLQSSERVESGDQVTEIPTSEPVRVPLLPPLQADWAVFILLWPFGALVSALRRLGMPGTKTVICLFCLYFGFVFIYGDPYRDQTTDSARYARELIDAHAHPLPLDQLVTLLYKPKTDLVDIYQPLLTWIVSLFTGDPRVLFALYAGIFGLFWAQNIWLVHSRIGPITGWFLFLFLGAFAMINPVWNINGVRMWTAGQIYIFGILLWFFEGKKAGLLWSSLSILVHFSFSFPVVLFFIYFLLPGNLFLWFLFFAATSFVREIDLKVVRELLDYLPDIFRDRLEGYTSENYARSLMKTEMRMPLYVQLSEKVANAIVYLWASVLFLTRREWGAFSPELKKLFGFALFMGGFAQVVSLIPSGLRFIVIAHSLFYAAFIPVIANLPSKPSFNLLKAVTVPLLVYFIFFNVRMGFDFIGILTFLGNPLVALISPEHSPLIELVKIFF
ncbi:MAG TPA: EpsG family protein [Prolixibacteraceae bacterium]|jgi:hypothetical protein|nr:EpsG family protein [Prolixibacteraceae bacterium]HRV88800.1 EpsG family protein [Prolixibacteraceae bacterium]